MRPWFLGAVCLAGVASTAPVHAEDTPASVKELDAVAQWLTAKKVSKCTERCFVLSKLELGGSVETGALTFQLTGTALADHPVAVPLFGPPNKVRLEGVTDGDQPAAVGFEGDHYFVMTRGGEGGRFTVKGRLYLEGDRALSIPGPLNVLDAHLEKGRVVEGARLSGLTATTIHFDSGKAEEGASAPVFQLSRAIRVQRETSFEYRLVLRSGADLGVVRLPLTLGEKVIDVVGSAGWKVEANELVLPTAGKNATFTITGTLADAQKTLTPDPRSPYEWWLVESDAEHRVTAENDEGSAAQLDATESPIPRTQPTARLFLAKKGQHLAVSVQTLAVAESLGAVIREHHRTVVLTARGDLVGDETFAYENNGLDHLPVVPAGLPIFQATDGLGERIMRRDPALAEILLPLRKGVHVGRLQTVSESKLGLFAGVLELGPSSMPLTASRASLQVGLPADVHPLLALGGDHAVWLVGPGGLVALLVAAVLASLAFAKNRDRGLATVGLAGVYALSPPAFAAVAFASLVALALAFCARAFAGATRTRALVGVGAGAAFAVLFAVVAFGARSFEGGAPRTEQTVAYRPTPTAGDSPTSGQSGLKADEKKPDDGKNTKDATEKPPVDALGNWQSNMHAGGLVQGVQPVALPLPSAARWVTVARELVPQDRPLRVRIYYVTSTVLAPLVALWLACLASLAFVHRRVWWTFLAGLRARPAATAPTPAE